MKRRMLITAPAHVQGWIEGWPVPAAGSVPMGEYPAHRADGQLPLCADEVIE